VGEYGHDGFTTGGHKVRRASEGAGHSACSERGALAQQNRCGAAHMSREERSSKREDGTSGGNGASVVAACVAGGGADSRYGRRAERR
jgi:hypothetical protein